MLSTSKGIDLTKREIVALLAFSGEKSEHAVIHLRIKGTTLTAGATDSQHSVELESTNDGGEDGEWAVVREFLELCAAGLENGSAKVPATVCRLLVTKSGVTTAHVIDQESGKKIVPIGPWNKNAANTQVSLDGIQATIPKHSLKGSWFAVDPKQLSVLTKVSLASGKCPLSVMPPTDNLGPILFEASGPGGTWRGIILPVATIGPGKTRIAPAAEPDPSVPDAQETDGEPEPLELEPTEKPKRKRGRPKLEADKDAKPSTTGRGQKVVKLRAVEDPPAEGAEA